MSDKSVELKRQDNNNEVSKNDMDSNSTIVKTLKYQIASVNYWGEGPFDDELVLSYDY